MEPSMDSTFTLTVGQLAAFDAALHLAISAMGDAVPEFRTLHDMVSGRAKELMDEHGPEAVQDAIRREVEDTAQTHTVGINGPII